MYRKSLLLIAAAMTTSVAFADVSRADFSAFRNARNSVAVSLDEAPVSFTEPISDIKADPRLTAGLLAQSETSQPSENVPFSKTALDKPILSAVKGSVSTSARIQRKASGKVVPGTLFSTDINYKGVTYHYRLNLTKVETEGAAAGAYTLTGIYGQSTPVNVTIDEAKGSVTIPCQKIAQSGDDNIMIAPMTFSGNQITYSTDDIVGTIDAEGVITLPGWGVLITEGDNKGKGYNFFTGSTIRPANATVTAVSLTQNGSENLSYSIYIDQTSDNTLTFIGLSGVTAESIDARLTSTKQVQVPNSFVYTNLFYGDFFLFPVNADGKAVAGKDLIGTASGSSITFPGWAIASRTYPTLYVGYRYNDIKVNPSVEIKWPAAPSFSGTGSGTQADPYIITTAAQLQTIASAINEGNSYKGAYFKLGADIDLSSVGESLWLPLGNETTPFEGNLDGAGHTLKNLTISNTSATYMGIFGFIGPDGVVKNMNLNNIRINSSGSYIGVLAGFCQGTIEGVNSISSVVIANGYMGAGIAAALQNGSISNCSFQGALQGNGSLGGIVSQAAGSTITNCHARANIIHKGYFDSTAHDAGGVAGVVLTTTISGCTSTGTIQDTDGYAASGALVGRLITQAKLLSSMTTMNILATGNPTLGSSTGTVINCYQGGLAGYASESEIRDCLTTSYLQQTSSAAQDLCGGLLGYLAAAYSYSSDGTSELKNVPDLYNCYFAGQVNSASPESSKNIYGGTFISTSWTGQMPYEVAFHDCYYDNQIAMISGDEWGRPTTSFTASLPAGFDSSVWKAQAGHYPVIAANASSQVAELASAPLILAANQTVNKVSKDFTITPMPNVTWAISDGEMLVQSNDVLAISGSTVSLKNAYGVEMIVADSKDGWGRKYYRLSVAPALFEGEGTAESPFLIKSAADFETLDNAVRNFGQGHEGDYFAVTNDIDFASSKFDGVGSNTGRAFAGVVDGRNHTIHNLKIDGVVTNAGDSIVVKDSKQYIGLFGILDASAVIKNINFASDCSFKGLSYVGSVAGASFGKIENCRNYAPVSAASSFAGGITGYMINSKDNLGNPVVSSYVTGCYNAGDVTGAVNSHGGIAGFTSSVISLCQNDGNVTAKSITANTANVSHNSAGGIVGQINMQINFPAAVIDRCVNNGNISAVYSVGGIIGSMSSGEVKGSVNNGLVTCINDDTRRGGVIGNFTGTVTAENNFYDSSINVNGGAMNAGMPGITGLASEVLTAAPITDLSAETFNFSKGMYPVLGAFKDEAATKVIRSMVAYFPENVTRLNVNKQVGLSEGTVWKLKHGDNFSIDGNTLKVTMPEGNVIPTDTLTATNGNYSKMLSISVIPAILKGDGTASAPFLIETPADWNKLSDFMLESKYEYPGSHFQVVNDLDFKGDSIRLLAVNGVKFNGVFDGNGKCVSNFVYNNPNSVATPSRWKGPNLYRGVNIGLFGTIGSEGVLKNLSTNGELQAMNNIGGLVGDLYGVVDNCEHKGKIHAASSNYASGIANKVYAGGQILNCVNSGTVTTKTTYAQGIVNTVMDGALVKNCQNKGTVNPTTTGASGIAYSVAGTMTGCSNSGILKCTGSAAGVVYSLAKTGKLEDCYNTSDILLDSKGGNVAGVVYSTVDNTADFEGEPAHTSWIKNCYNTGNLSGKSNVHGFTSAVKKGVLIEDCYNTGNVTAVTTNGAYGFCAAISSNNADTKLATVIRRSWNSGNVQSKTSSSATTCGFAKSTTSGTVMENCYNIGDVTVLDRPTSNGVMCISGFIGQISGGTITDCWNAGDVNTLSPSTAGFGGYIAGTDCTLVQNCFNLGNVTGSNIYLKSGVETEGNTNGTAGGLFGYISTGNPKVINCYNAGNVTGNNRVGGIAGGMFRPDAVLENVYNVGKVTCGNNWWSGTVFTNNTDYNGVSYFANSKNVYYDADVTTGKEYRNFPGSAKTTAELTKLNLGEAFMTGYGYPFLKSFEAENTTAIANAAAAVSVATPLLAEGDSISKVTKAFTLLSAPAVSWTSKGDGELQISGSTATPVKDGKITLTAAGYEDLFKRNFELTLLAKASGIEGIADGKEIKSTLFIDMNGRIIPAPAEGQPFVVKVTYTDGTSETRKVINK